MRLTRTIAAPVQQPHVMFYARQAEKKMHTCDYAIISFTIFAARDSCHYHTQQQHIYIYLLHIMKKEEWGERAMNIARFLYIAAI